jgi:hypothetical protein
MTFLAISLLVFGLIILFTTIIFIYWWKKFGKSLFSTLNDLKSMQNPSNFMENMKNLGNLDDFQKNLGSIKGKMTNFNQRMSEIGKKMNNK